MNKERTMTILITGATGFIGKYLCLTLLQQAELGTEIETFCSLSPFASGGASAARKQKL